MYVCMYVCMYLLLVILYLLSKLSFQVNYSIYRAINYCVVLLLHTYTHIHTQSFLIFLPLYLQATVSYIQSTNLSSTQQAVYHSYHF